MRRGHESPIPARIILNWDHKPRPICRASKDFLKTIYDRAIIRIDRVNPMIYDNASKLKHIYKLRLKLSHAAMYLLSCKKSISDDLKRRLYPHEYLYTDVHLYSIKVIACMQYNSINPAFLGPRKCDDRRVGAPTEHRD
jgi:hypothetical protein